MSDDIPDDLIDFKEARRLLRCDLSTCHRWRMAGRFRAWKRGGRYFASRAELLALFRQTDGPRPAPARAVGPVVDEAGHREALEWLRREGLDV